MPLMSIRGYARHRADLGLPGGTHRAVQKAIQAGRCPIEPNGQIDSEKADAAWAENTNAVKRAPTEAEAATPAFEPPQGSPGSRGPSLAQAQAVEKTYRARLARLEWEERTGSLVPVADVKLEWAKIIAEARTKLLGIPAKAKSRIPDLTLADVATLDDLIRETLEALAEETSPDDEAA